MRNIIALSSLMALGLSGCMGGTTTAPTIDMTAVGGDGSVSTPYQMHTSMPAGTNGGMEDYLAQGGYWTFNIHRSEPVNFTISDIDTTATRPVRLGSMTYNPDTDVWSMSYIDATTGLPVLNKSMVYDAALGLYYCKTCVDYSMNARAAFKLFDKSETSSQYGTFGYSHYSDLGTLYPVESFEYFTTGLRTSDMPTTGSFNYTGDFEATLARMDTGYHWTSTGGKIAVAVNFGATSSQLLFSTTNRATFDAPVSTTLSTHTYEISGSATISGNEFNSVNFDGTRYYADGTVLDSWTGTLVGGFYGPDASELAGTFQQTSGDASGAGMHMVGGLWAAQ